MAKNYLQEGDVQTFTAPYAVASGAGFQVGSLVAIAQYAAASGATVEGAVESVFVVTKAAGSAWTDRGKIYWDNTAKNFTSVSTSNQLCGCSVGAALTADVIGTVYLDGAVR